jgi:hypothetical protein
LRLIFAPFSADKIFFRLTARSVPGFHESMTAEEAMALPVDALLYKGQGKRRETYVVEGKDGKQIWLRARRLLGQTKLVTGEYRDHHFWKDVRRKQAY